MILAAGLGTRLRPLTHHLPKPLVPVHNRSIIAHHLQMLATLGVREVMLNLHYLPEVIQETIGDGSAWDLRVHYSIETPDVLGTGGGLAKVQDFFADQELFLFLNGDILHEIPLAQAIAKHREEQATATLILRPHPGDEKTGWIGVDDQGHVRRVPDMEANPTLQKRMFTGLHILSPTIFRYLPKEPCCILRTGYRAMLAEGLHVTSFDAQAHPWHDIGNPHDYLHTNMHLLQQDPNHTLIDPHAQVDPSAEIGPYCVIGKGATVGAGCHLKHAVVWPNARIAPNQTLHNGIAYHDDWLQVSPPVPAPS